MLFITSFAVLIDAEPISPAAPNPRIVGTTAKAISTIISTYLALAAKFCKAMGLLLCRWVNPKISQLKKLSGMGEISIGKPYLPTKELFDSLSYPTTSNVG
jgi:hypothetical protein